MKAYLTGVFFFFAIAMGFSQEVPFVADYVNAMLVHNPAYAGRNDGLTAGLLTRSQWSGFDGGKQVQLITAHSRLGSPQLGGGLE
ncbi:MAG: type IX secretion system membrane protein PorP/SprF, partial [Flavobacteriales bacterium]|nr:type IX secretion system membrane protein PorP/SprF [Flavobacteriales bacterium]